MELSSFSLKSSTKNIHKYILSNPPKQKNKYDKVHDVICGSVLFIYLPFSFHLFSAVLCLFNKCYLFASLQSPCEYSPCKNGATCRPLYGSNGFICERSPGSIEQGKINVGLKTVV